MENTPEKSKGKIVVVPYHCKELGNRDDLQPLVDALAEVCDLKPSDIPVEVQEPLQTEGVESALVFLAQFAAHHPIAATAAGGFAGGILKRFGEKFADWVVKTLSGLFGGTKSSPSDASRSLSCTLEIHPPADYPKTHSFPIAVNIEVQPSGSELRPLDAPTPPQEQQWTARSFRSEISFEIGRGQIESPAVFRQRMAAELSKLEAPIHLVLQDMRDKRAPREIRYAFLAHDAATGRYRVECEYITPNHIGHSYIGSITPTGIEWKSVT